MKDPFPKARIQSLKTIKNTQHYFDDGVGVVSVIDCSYWHVAFFLRCVHCYGMLNLLCVNLPLMWFNLF